MGAVVTLADIEERLAAVKLTDDQRPWRPLDQVVELLLELIAELRRQQEKRS